MGTIAIMRSAPLPEQAAQLARVFSSCFEGATERDAKGWTKFWKWLGGKELGEIVEISVHFVRSGPFHRRHFKIEGAVFEAQERFKVRDMFHDWLKIGAGFVDWCAGPKGGVVPVPKKLSYAKCDQAEFEVFHRDMIEFLRGEHAQKYLWPHLPPAQRAEMVESVLMEFGA